MKRLLTLVLSVFVFLPVFSQSGEEELKVLAFNIWNGHDWGKDTARHDAMVAWIKEQAPDVAALQELCGYTQEKLAADARVWGHPYAVILKEDGYPVGITSRRPIHLKARLREGLWHGLIHAETYGIDFFVVHLSPADRDTRYREAGIIESRVRGLQDSAATYILLGDFNAMSPMDADLNLGRPQLLARYREGDRNQEKYRNLLLEEFDYSVISRFYGLPAIDVCHRYVPVARRYSFPTPILVGLYMEAEQVPHLRQRIDYILASPALAAQCTGAEISNGPVEGTLSDHYPVMATFSLVP